MPAVFGVMCFIAMIWSAVKYQFVYRAVIDTLPPQFQENSRYAFPVYALSPSTPLPMQAEYMQSLWGACAALLCASLAFFSAHNVPFGAFCLIGCLWGVIYAFKSQKTYRENCNRAENQFTGEQ